MKRWNVGSPEASPTPITHLLEPQCNHRTPAGAIVLALSYTKMLGQLHEAGNTTTLAHYLELLTAAGMLSGLPKYAEQMSRSRASSPKFQVLNTALMTAQAGVTLTDAPTASSGAG